MTKYKEITVPFYRLPKPEQYTQPHHCRHSNHLPATSVLQPDLSATPALEPSQLHITAGCDGTTGSHWLGGCAPSQSGQLNIQTCNKA